MTINHSIAVGIRLIEIGARREFRIIGQSISIEITVSELICPDVTQHQALLSVNIDAWKLLCGRGKPDSGGTL